TRDPEVRYTPQGTAVCSFGLAVNHTYRSRDGEPREDVCFIEIETWGRQAENCGQYLKKGSPVLVEGRLKYHTWESQDGQKRSRHKVTALRVQFLSAGSGPGPKSGDDYPAPPTMHDEVYPDDGTGYTPPPGMAPDGGDDIPF
nr:single-stranded DNA-binding protein [bacterium]